MEDIFTSDPTQVVTEVGRVEQYGYFDMVAVVREEGMTEVCGNFRCVRGGFGFGTGVDGKGDTQAMTASA